MKLKADGSKCTQLNTTGCSQVVGQHYDDNNILSPVTNAFLLCIAFTIMLLCGFVEWVVEVNGVFLLGKFKNQKE
jgi:hypothetical protein